MTQLKTEARAKGDTILKKSFPKEHDYLVNDLAPFCQEMSDAIIDHAYGKIWARDELSKRMRSLVTVVSLAAVGGNDNVLRIHIKAAFSHRCTLEELRESFLHMHLYVGFPKAVAALTVLREVVTEMAGGKDIKDFESDPSAFIPEEQMR